MSINVNFLVLSCIFSFVLDTTVRSNFNIQKHIKWSSRREVTKSILVLNVLALLHSELLMLLLFMFGIVSSNELGAWISIYIFYAIISTKVPTNIIMKKYKRINNITESSKLSDLLLNNAIDRHLEIIGLLIISMFI